MQNPLVDVNREEFLERRRKGVFASDVGPICRLSRFGYGPLDVAVDKLTGRTGGADSPSQRMGRLLEPTIAMLYEEKTDTILKLAAPAFGNPLPWMGAHADREFLLPECRRLVELKACRDRRGWGDSEREEIPADIFLQVQWQMSCYDAERCDVAVLFQLEDFEVYPIQRDQAVIDRAVDVCGEFWRMIERGEWPEVDWSDPRAKELVPMMHRPDKTKSVALTDDDVRLVNEYQMLGETERTTGKLRSDFKARILDRLGDAARGVLPDGRCVVNSIVPVAKHTVQAHESRRLTIRLR